MLVYWACEFTHVRRDCVNQFQARRGSTCPIARIENASGRMLTQALAWGYKIQVNGLTIFTPLLAETMRSIRALMLDTPDFVGWPKAEVHTLVVTQRMRSGAAPSRKLFGRTCGRGFVTWRLAILTARGSFFASVFCKHLQALTDFVFFIDKLLLCQVKGGVVFGHLT